MKAVLTEAALRLMMGRWKRMERAAAVVASSTTS
jgi:hypothetical protein